MPTFKTTPAKIYALDEDTLFLLRVRAMQDNSRLQTNRKFHSVAELKSHLSTIRETRSYFTDLKMNIGPADGNGRERRRTPLKLKNVWREVSHIFSHDLTAGKYSEMGDVEFIAEVFGFGTVQDMENAAISRGYDFQGKGNVSIDVQDRIARAFNAEDWLKFTGQDDQKYLVSESVLQRAYGIYKCKSRINETTLNYISQYICDKNWAEYDTPDGRRQAYDAIIKSVIKPQMKTVVGQLYPQTKTTPFPNVKEGDHITITHADGTKDVFEYHCGEFHPVTTNSEMCA